MTGPSPSERETARLAGEVARRAIRRLDVLEWMIFAAALVLAILGGAGVAWLMTGPDGADFRRTWMVASVLLFVIPGGIVIYQAAAAERSQSTDNE